MLQPEQLADRLTRAIRHPAHTPGLAAYHLSWTETRSLDSNGASEACEVILRLIWQDGCVSLHRVSPSLLADGLPLAAFSRRRFREDGLRLLAKPQAVPAVSLRDEAIIAALDNGRIPIALEGFTGRFRVQRRTVAQSNGLYLSETATEARFFPQESACPFDSHSRRLPDEALAEYLQSERDWFNRLLPASRASKSVTPHTLFFASEATPFTRAATRHQSTDSHLARERGASTPVTVLFSPSAVRSLMHAGFGVHLTEADGLPVARRLIEHGSRHAAITLRHDPLRPWSPGSYRFSDEGTPARTVTLFAPGHRQPAAFLSCREARRLGIPPAPGYNPLALHWRTGKTLPFRQWLQTDETAICLSRIHLPECCSPFAPQACWSPRAVLFRRSRPEALLDLRFDLSLADLLSSPRLLGVTRPGWDACGLAVPAVWAAIPG